MQTATLRSYSSRRELLAAGGSVQRRESEQVGVRGHPPEPRGRVERRGARVGLASLRVSEAPLIMRTGVLRPRSRMRFSRSRPCFQRVPVPGMTMSSRMRSNALEKPGAHIMRNGFLFRLQRDTTGADACRLRLRTYSISRLNATLT